MEIPFYSVRVVGVCPDRTVVVEASLGSEGNPDTCVQISLDPARSHEFYEHGRELLSLQFGYGPEPSSGRFTVCPVAAPNRSEVESIPLVLRFSTRGGIVVDDVLEVPVPRTGQPGQNP